MIKICWVLEFVYDVHACRMLGIGFSDRIDQCVLRVGECEFVCMYDDF